MRVLFEGGEADVAVSRGERTEPRAVVKRIARLASAPGVVPKGRGADHESAPSRAARHGRVALRLVKYTRSSAPLNGTGPAVRRGGRNFPAPVATLRAVSMKHRRVSAILLFLVRLTFRYQKVSERLPELQWSASGASFASGKVQRRTGLRRCRFGRDWPLFRRRLPEFSPLPPAVIA